MIKHTWNILKLVAHKEIDNHKNVIYQINWEYISNDGEVSDKIIGSTNLDIVVNDNFVSYEDLTQEIIGSWIEEQLGEEKIEEMRKINIESIEYLKNIIELDPPSS